MSKQLEQLFESAALLSSRYQLRRPLGEGAAGTVYLAEDTEAGNELLAIKVLHSHHLLSEEAFARFRVETRITMRLSHPNILPTYGFGTHGETLSYLKMEYNDGATLAELIEADRLAGDSEQKLRLLHGIASALSYAHGQGIIHRDLKPENIMISNEGQLRVADFGIAQMLRHEAKLTGRGDLLGTPYYMAPEQLRAELLDGRADMYAFGIVAFELCCGVRPFEAAAFWDLAEKHINAPLPIELLQAAEVPPKLQEIIERCTAKDRRERYDSMEEVVQALAGCCGEVETTSFSDSYENKSLIAGSEINNAKKIAARHRRFDRGLRFLIILTFLSASILAPHLNNSAQWRYSGLVLRAERLYGEQLSWLRTLFATPAELSYPESFFNVQYKQFVLPLLIAGYDPNPFSEQYGFYPVHFAALQTNDGRALRELAAYGADINSLSNIGWTPLHYAVHAGSAPAVTELLLLGAEAEIPDSKGDTPLLVAAKASRTAMVELLLEYRGATLQLDMQDQDGTTALHAAVQNGNTELARMLLHAGADPLLKDNGDRSARDVAASVQSPQLRELFDLPGSP